MAIINIDQAKATIWAQEVAEEVKQVRLILDKSSAALAQYPEQDTLIEDIANVGMKMQDLWTYTCNKLDEAQDKVKEALNWFKKGISNSIDYISELGQKVTRK